MNFKDYIKNALRTENIDFDGIRNRLSLVSTMRLLHGSIGISTEAGELLDAMKKFVFYGRPIDRINVKEEIGDTLYYTALLIDEMGFDLDDILQINSDKLRARYPEKFDSDKATNRNLDTERKILES